MSQLDTAESGERELQERLIQRVGDRMADRYSYSTEDVIDAVLAEIVAVGYKLVPAERKEGNL